MAFHQQTYVIYTSDHVHMMLENLENAITMSVLDENSRLEQVNTLMRSRDMLFNQLNPGRHRLREINETIEELMYDTEAEEAEEAEEVDDDEHE